MKPLLEESVLWAALCDAVERAAATLGRGVPAGVHADALAVELESAGVRFERQVELRVAYGGRVLETPVSLPLLLQGELPVLLASGPAPDPAALMARVLEWGGWRRGAVVNLDASEPSQRVGAIAAGAGKGAARKRLRPDARKGAERLSGQPPRS